MAINGTAAMVIKIMTGAILSFTLGAVTWNINRHEELEKRVRIVENAVVKMDIMCDRVERIDTTVRRMAIKAGVE